MTKKQRAIEIYGSLNGASRDVIIQAFIEQLDMTPAGAATYYATCRKDNGHSTPRARKKKDDYDNRTLFTCCEIENDVVVSTSSHFNKEDALLDQRPNIIIVEGLPPIDEPLSSNFTRI